MRIGIKRDKIFGSSMVIELTPPYTTNFGKNQDAPKESKSLPWIVPSSAPWWPASLTCRCPSDVAQWATSAGTILQTHSLPGLPLWKVQHSLTPTFNIVQNMLTSFNIVQHISTFVNTVSTSLNIFRHCST